mgnify:CR=1 FL=1
MVSNTKEQALEAAIEQALTGQCLETLGSGIGEAAAVYAKPHHGFVLGLASDFDKQYAIDTRLFWQFRLFARPCLDRRRGLLYFAIENPLEKLIYQGGIICLSYQPSQAPNF